MEAVRNYLAKWLVDYLKNRDLVFKQIETINHEQDKVIVQRKDKTVVHYILAFQDTIDNHVIAMRPEEHYGLVFYNSENNLRALLKHWPSLEKIPNLVVYFVNPFSKTDKKWIVFPHTHSRVADNDSLELGLRAMFDMVEPITEAEVKKIVSA